jgi:predicted nucleotide-binding protein
MLQSDVPNCSLEDALRIGHAICDNYAKAPTKPLQIALALGLDLGAGQFRMLCGASSAYGLTQGSYRSEVISLSDLGRRILVPTMEGDDLKAKREAFLKPRIIGAFLRKYNQAKLPPEKIALNVLQEMGVSGEVAQKTYGLIISGSETLALLKKNKENLWVDLSTEIELRSVDQLERKDDTSPSLTAAASQAPDAFNQAEGASPVSKSILSNRRVFITHGKNKEILTQLKELLSFGQFEPIVAEEHETLSKPLPDKVMDDMRSCSAGIIHVGKEIKVLDQEGKEHVFLNQNVLIEIGASMALYGRRFILLVERGAELPSNLQGLYVVRYEGDRLDYDATMKLLKAFSDFRV